MIVILVVCGKSCVGKSQIAKAIESLGFKRIITYTDRIMRQGEVNHVDYHFLQKDEFTKKLEDGFFAEWKSYNTKLGEFRYGTSKESLLKGGDSVIILTPEGVKDILSNGIHNITVVLIDADDEVIKERQRLRGDDPKESERRFVQDIIDFKGMEDYADFIIMNNGEFTPEQIAQVIVEGYYGLEK